MALCIVLLATCALAAAATSDAWYTCTAYGDDATKCTAPHTALGPDIEDIDCALHVSSGACRLEPLWRRCYNECAKATRWSPRSLVWSKYRSTAQPLIRQCMDEAFRAKVFSGSEASSLRDTIATLNASQTSSLVEVESALTQPEAFAVFALSECVKRHARWNAFEVRDFGNDADAYGSNDCTYLAGYLQVFTPGVAAQASRVLQLAKAAAQWQGDVSLLGVRTAEHLHYHAGGRLGNHEDTGSNFTMVVLLSDRHEYEGGEFELLDGNLKLKPSKLSGVVFLSDATHSVSPMSAGSDRRSFAVEYWEDDDVTPPHRRPSSDIYEKHKHEVEL